MSDAFSLVLQVDFPTMNEVYDYRIIEVNITEQDRFHIVMNESLAVALLTNLLSCSLSLRVLCVLCDENDHFKISKQCS